MQKKPERWLIVAAILLASFLATVALVSTLENASFLAGLVSAVIATLALLAVYQRDRSDPEPGVGGVTRPAGFLAIFTRRQWSTVIGGVLACALVGVVASFIGPDRGEGGDLTASTKEPITPATASTSPSAESAEPAEPTPTDTAVPTDTLEATDSPSADPSESVGLVDGTQPLAPLVYLDELDPAQGGRNTGPVLFSNKQYPRSVQTYCWHANSDAVEWNVAGYKSFTAMLGVDDNAERASGRTAQFTFYNQDGRKLAGPVDVSLGHAKPVSIALGGAVRLRVTCGGRDTRTNEVKGLYGAMGDAQIAK